MPAETFLRTGQDSGKRRLREMPSDQTYGETDLYRLCLADVATELVPIAKDRSTGYFVLVDDIYGTSNPTDLIDHTAVGNTTNSTIDDPRDRRLNLRPSTDSKLFEEDDEASRVSALRRLLQKIPTRSFPAMSVYPSSNSTSRRLNHAEPSESTPIDDNDNGSSDGVFYGVPCHCALPLPILDSAVTTTDDGAKYEIVVPEVYCPKIAPICLINWDAYAYHPVTDDVMMVAPSVTCYGHSQMYHLQYLIPVTILLFLLLSLLLAFSPKGVYARTFGGRFVRCLSKEQYQEKSNEQVDCLIRRQVRYHEALRERRVRDSAGTNVQVGHIPAISYADEVVVSSAIRQYLRENSQEGATGYDESNRISVMQFFIPQAPPLTVSLRTLRYQPHTLTGSKSDDPGHDGVDEEDQNSESEVLCSICLGDLDYGDRVGDLSCGHVFHSDCLKSWIQRRKNHCPLCKTALINPPKADLSEFGGTDTSTGREDEGEG